MLELNKKLHTLAANWRRKAHGARDVAKDMPNLLARGHLHGVSDGLSVAADDVEALLKRDLPAAPVV